MMDKETILKAAEYCMNESITHCDSCPLDKRGMICGYYFAKYIKSQQEKEPAPSANDTSSKENNLHDKYITSLKECQEAMFDLYANLNEIERRVWNAGESYGRICVLIDELDGKED